MAASFIETSNAHIEERAHPLALTVWSLLRDRSVADKMLVLNACDRRLGRGDMTEKQEQAHFAVSLFVEALGHLPHATEWDDWRRERADLSGLPSATFIRNAFGSWHGLRAAFVTTPEVDVLSARLTSNGRLFSDTELLDVIRVWARDTTAFLGINQLDAWLNSERPKSLGLSRWPRHYATFARLGGLEQALKAAGVWDPTRRDPTPNGSRRRGRVRRPSLRAELLDELKVWAVQAEGALIQRDFIAHLSQLPMEHPLGGLGSVKRKLQVDLGTWAKTLADAGLSHRSTAIQTPGTLFGPAPESGTVPPADTSDLDGLASWVRVAAASGFGPAMSYPQYEEWRRARLRNAVDQGRQPERIPTFMTLKRYLGGSWFTVKVRAGVAGAEEYALTRSHRLTYTREQVEDAVRDAASDQLGPDPDLGLLQPGLYKLWRDNKLADARGRCAAVRVPNVDLVRKVLGGPKQKWSVVLASVFDLDEAEAA